MPLQRIAFLLIVLFAAQARAQNLLYVEHKGQMFPVVKASEGRAYIIENGKTVGANGKRFALQEVDEYVPALVEVRDLRLSSAGMESMDDASTFNNRLEFRADFSSAYDLRNVFVVLDLRLANGTKAIFFREVGHLEPGKSRHLKVFIPLESPFGEGTYHLHLFADGEEVLNSWQSEKERTSIWDRIIAKRIANLHDAEPRPFFGPPPAYPGQLLSKKIEGHAIVRLHIDKNGATSKLALVEATDPAFGESAIAVMKQWRFLPKVKGGDPVGADAEIPLSFSPPSKS